MRRPIAGQGSAGRTVTSTRQIPLRVLISTEPLSPDTPPHLTGPHATPTFCKMHEHMKLKLFDRFLQLVPVLIPFMACVGVVAKLLPTYGELDTRFALVLSVILAVYMLLMLWHTSTSELLQTSYLTGATRTIRRIVLLIVLSLIGIGFAYLLFLVRPR